MHRITEALQRLLHVDETLKLNQRNWLLCFLLPSSQDEFVEAVRAELEALSGWLETQGARVDVRTVDARAPVAAATAVKRLRGQHDAMVAMLPDHPLVREAMELVAGDGTCLVTLASGITSRLNLNYIGIDNVAAGRTAASLLGRFASGRQGQVGILIGSHAMKDQADRLCGFREAMAVNFPNLELLEPIECRDRDARTQSATAQLVEDRPHLVGLYSVGAGNRGVHQGLRNAGAKASVTWVCHDLTTEARAALIDGSADAVIGPSVAQLTRAACKSAINQLSRQPALRAVETLRIEIHLKENLS